MIHTAEISLEQRGAHELLESTMRYLVDRYADATRCDWNEFHYMTAYNILRERAIAIQVDACNRRAV